MAAHGTSAGAAADATVGWLDVIDPNSESSEVLAGFNLAADLVRRQVAVIVTETGTEAHAAKATTQSIPIVFSMGGDLWKRVWSQASITPEAI